MTTWVKKLTDWFIKQQRPMPWRETASPYRTWLSEIMLQQTQVDTVIPYFNRFLKAFPSVEDLAQADQQQVLKLWEGLGYYSRARNLHKAAKLVVSDYNSQLPESYEGLQKIPGIGPYCAAAITSIAFNNPVPVVDGNVLRVFTRFWGITDDIRLPKVRDFIFEKLRPPILEAKPADFNQGIMELGALLCKPQNPKCEQCPIQTDCYAYKHKKTGSLPYKSPAKKTPHYNIGVGVIWRDDKILIAKRKESQMLGGLWEFPGGKQNPAEKIEKTIEREIKEETSLDVKAGEFICKVNHAFTHFKITIFAYHCEALGGREKPLSSDELKWVSLGELATYPFPKANTTIIQAL